jgi:predicted dehydrogenase
VAEKTNVAIIGLGAIGQRVLRDFEQHEKVEVTALCDMDETALNGLKERMPNAALYRDHQDMLEREDVQLVYLAVPPKFHQDIALDVIEKGIHLLCEKPLANSLEEAAEMKEAAEKAGIVHAMNFPMVYSTVFHLLKEKVLSGELGGIKRVELNLHFTQWPRAWQRNNWISSREQGGFIREVAPHYIQMIQSLFGKLKVTSSFIDYPEDLQLCEKGFISRLELEGGVPVLFNGVSGIGQKEHLSFKIFGENGTLDLTNWSQLAETKGESESTAIHVERTKSMNLVTELLNAIEGERAHLVSFDEGLEVQRVLEEILKN